MIEQIENQEMIRELMKNKLIYGAISIILVVLVSKIILNLLRKLIDKFLGGRVVKKSDVNKNKISTISKALYSVIRIVIIFIAITMILDIFGINTSTLIATAGVGGVAIALGTQTLIADFIKGIFIILDDKIRVGEWIMAAGVEGEVEALDFRVTKVRDFDGSLHIIPNSEITTVRNFNRGFMASDATFSVSYDTSLEEVKEAMKKFTGVASRFEYIENDLGLNIVIDFAHTPFAYESLFKSVPKGHKTFAVFGVNGDRNKEFRVSTGKACAENDVFAVVTTDDPKFDTLENINRDIIEGIKANGGEYIEINVRKEAIRYAVTHAKKGDFIFLLGKGEENFLKLKGNEKTPYSERDTLKEVLESL